MDRDDRTTDTGMLGSDAEDPGPGRDTRQTDLDPAETSSEHPTRTVGMSGSDPERTRLGTQETSGRPLADAPQDMTSSGQADTGMVGSETELDRNVVDDTPVRVEYCLTDKGRALEPAVRALKSWAHDWM